MKLLTLLAFFPALAVAQGLNAYGPGQVPKPRTNLAVQSNSLSTAGAATSPYAVYRATVATVAGAPASVGGGTWAEVTGTNPLGGGDILYAVVATPGALVSQTLSVWVAVGTGGDGKAGVALRCTGGTVASCSCGRSDGGTCTSSSTVGASDCEASVTDAPAGGVRLWTVVKCNGHSAASALLYAGTPGVAATVTRFTGLQLESGVTKPGKICVTTTTSATCK